MSGFDAALAAGQDEFVKRRIYLTLERGRDIALRNLFRKVFIAGGFVEAGNGGEKVRRTRIATDEFIAAMRLGLRRKDGEGVENEIERDEVECLMANMIYKVRLSLPSAFLQVATTQAVRHVAVKEARPALCALCMLLPKLSSLKQTLHASRHFVPL